MLQKMASAIQTTKGIRDEIPLRTRILSLSTLVLNHLLHPGMLLNSCTEEFLDKLKKQNRNKRYLRIDMNNKIRDSVTYVSEKHRIPNFRILISALIIAPAQFFCQDCVKPSSLYVIPIYINKKI